MSTPASPSHPMHMMKAPRHLASRDPAFMLAWTEAFCRAGVEQASFSLWEPLRRAAVLGLSQEAERELHRATLEAEGVPILRRPSGGGAVILSPGILCFEVYMPVRPADPCPDIHGAFREATAPVLAACRALGVAAVQAGISDLAAPEVPMPNTNAAGGTDASSAVRGKAKVDVTQEGGAQAHASRRDAVGLDESGAEASTLAPSASLYKICGTAQLRKRGAVLVHGSLLVDVQTRDFGRFLRFPSEVPTYREGREHDAFCRTLRTIRGCPTTPGLVAEMLRTTMAEAGVEEVEIPERLCGLAQQLLEEKYRQASWNLHRQRPKGL